LQYVGEHHLANVSDDFFYISDPVISLMLCRGSNWLSRWLSGHHPVTVTGTRCHHCRLSLSRGYQFITQLWLMRVTTHN